MTDRVRQSIKRHAQVHRLGREVHPYGTRQQDHDALVSSMIIAAVQIGDAPVTSTTTPLGSRSSTVAPVEMIVAGASRSSGPSAAAGAVVLSRRRHQYSRGALTP